MQIYREVLIINIIITKNICKAPKSKLVTKRRCLTFPKQTNMISAAVWIVCSWCPRFLDTHEACSTRVVRRRKNFCRRRYSACGERRIACQMPNGADGDHCRRWVECLRRDTDLHFEPTASRWFMLQDHALSGVSVDSCWYSFHLHTVDDIEWLVRYLDGLPTTHPGPDR